MPLSGYFVKAHGFKNLGQGSMSVKEYDTQFCQLEQFALHILLDGRKSIVRFLGGLHSELYQHVGLQTKTYPCMR